MKTIDYAQLETHLKSAIAALRLAQEEILFPCELYSQLDDMMNALETSIEDKAWERTAV